MQHSALLCVVVFIGVVAALQPTDHKVELFQPVIPRTYIHNINGSIVDVLPYESYVESDRVIDVALDLVSQVIGQDVQYIVQSEYQTEHNNVHHAYLRQTINKLEVFNADLNVNTWNRQVLSLGHSFYLGKAVAPKYTPRSAIDAVISLGKYLKIEVAASDLVNSMPRGTKQQQVVKGFPKVQAIKANLGYYILEGGEQLELVWSLEADMYDHWYNAFVSARDLSIVALFDWVNDINTYEAYPISVNDPEDGKREPIQNPAVDNASPLGWNDQGEGRTFTNTRGNNAYAQENWAGGSSWQNNQRPNGGPNLDFIFPIDFTQAPRSYINASTTNLFTWNNYIHDIFYQYGFTEAAGNFQENNFGKGGLGNDAVQANAQDGAGTNNANFATPVDGQRPRMRMYIWTTATPNRDGDLEQGIIIHEYAHGISNRLTGGPQNVNCLGSGEAGGMGEGWGDFFATALRQKPAYNRNDSFPMGAYSANNPNGIRKFPYTTNMTINPETYGYVNNAGYEGVHAKGEVWCGILWETYWNFVDQYGFDTNWYQGTGGNNKILRNVVDGMKLQPCTPNFVSARNAILQADKVNYNGENQCLLWKGFAKRGLGDKAVGTGSGVTKVVQDFTIPVGVCPV